MHLETRNTQDPLTSRILNEVNPTQPGWENKFLEIIESIWGEAMREKANEIIIQDPERNSQLRRHIRRQDSDSLKTLLSILQAPPVPPQSGAAKLRTLIAQTRAEFRSPLMRNPEDPSITI
jgi:hypothetical protein